MVPDFGIRNVIILLSIQLQEDEFGPVVSYNVATSSQVEIHVQSQDRMKFQQVIPYIYNTQINVSIVGSLCGQHSTPTIIQLSYSE